MSQPPFRRRDFLRSLAATVVVAGAACDNASPVPGVPLTPGTGTGGSGGGPPPGPTADDIFPQSLASGDPRPDSFIIWTRVEPEAAADEVSVEYIVAEDEALKSIVAQGSINATAGTDHTVKLKITGDPTVIKPGTHYYYQFSARGVTSRVGRTKTAPAPDADVPVRFAFAACQDFIGRYYHAWQALLDETSAAGKDLDFVAFLGDYVYETDGDPTFQTPDAARRVVLPVGKAVRDHKAATDLEDYRTLYKTYRGDAVLQKVHERFPFIIIWDDHEFCNDSAGTRSSDEPAVSGPADEVREPERRLNATRAWFEYQPVDVDAPKPDLAPEEFKMYRNLRFGRHVDLVLTDQRLYRDGPLVPEGPLNADVLKINENSSLGSHNFLLKAGLSGDAVPRDIGYDLIEAAAKPTLLGEPQKAWLIKTIKESTATWKVWGNEVCLWQNVADLRPITQLPEALRHPFYVSVDQWDGFRSERAEILTELSTVTNLVAVTGDVHSFFASQLYVDFDAPGTSVGAEFVVAGITSNPLQQEIKSAINADPLLGTLGLDPILDAFDDLLLDSNPHLVHSRTNATGVAVVAATAGAFEVTFLQQLGDVTKATYDGERETTVLHCVAGSPDIKTGPAPA